jgi:SAM-dependent methyltransferase
MTTSAHSIEAVTDSTSLDERLWLCCPGCGTRIGDLLNEANADTQVDCATCFLSLRYEDGIWKCLLPERALHFAKFIEDYESIRASEGRGSSDSAYYLALPYRDLSGRNGAQWAIRARTYSHIEQHIMPTIIDSTDQCLRILDLGAGNGWLSYRMALQRHAVVAVDLLTNDQDGLGAAKHFRQSLPTLFPRVQAELDHLPFAGDAFDLVIFNASFHYSEEYGKTLGEAWRCTRSGGCILIADTAWYSSEQSGQRMLDERRAAFIRRYGFPSDGLRSLEYLTDERLHDLEKQLGIQWTVHEPYYGLRWQMRPLVAKLRSSREPSRFRIYSAKASK